MYKFSLFLAAALFGSSLAFWPFSGADSGERGNGNGRYPPPQIPNSGEREVGRGRGGFPRPPPPTFLKSVNSTERREWFEIEHDRNATKGEIQAAQDQWAANQTSEVQQLYNEFKEDKAEFIQNITAKADEIASNFSQESQTVYNQIKEIIQNQDITKAEECNQIREALSNATKEVRRELKPLKKMLGKKCCNHKRGPGGPGGPFGQGGLFGGLFGGPRDDGPFANNGGFNGPRRGGRDSGSDEENFDGPRRGGGRRGSGSNSNSASNEDSEERPRPSRRPRPTGSPRPTGFPTGLPIDGSTNGQFPTIQPSSTTPGGFFRNLFRF